MELTPEQETARSEVVAWYREALKYHKSYYRDDPRQYYVLGGYAGTGKSALLPHIIDSCARIAKPSISFMGWRVNVCALAGKATLRVREIFSTTLPHTPGVDWTKALSISTIHKMMYRPVYKPNTTIIERWERHPDINADLLIVDEGSMVDPQIWQDLLSYDIPILVVGDPFQLAPIVSEDMAKKFPGARNFNIMKKPDSWLLEIHRQAQGNPIIYASMLIRKGKIPLPYVNYKNNNNPRLMHVPKDQKDIINERIYGMGVEDTIVLTSTNNHRINLNKKLRERRGIGVYKPSEPNQWIVPGDQLICLFNDYTNDVFNGQVVKALDYKYINSSYGVLTIEGGARMTICPKQLCEQQLQKQARCYDKDGNDFMPGLYDYGYAVTVHKSQGSQWKNVVVYNQRLGVQTDDEYARWLYTAITRASERLTIVT